LLIVYKICGTVLSFAVYHYDSFGKNYLLSSLLLSYDFLKFFDTEMLPGLIAESTSYKPAFVKYNV